MGNLCPADSHKYRSTYVAYPGKFNPTTPDHVAITGIQKALFAKSFTFEGIFSKQANKKYMT
jgi:hypothetical protein